MSQERETDPSTGFELEHFERNRYFQGKLMTAHDMSTEQQYHAARLESVNRLVTGTGIVSGLTISEFEHEDGELEVTVEPGLAIDSEGRPIVVRAPTTRTIQTGETDHVYLYIAYDEEPKDPVPVPGSGSMNGEESEESRVLEVFELVARETPPPSYKTTPTIEFPDFEQADDPEQFANELLETYHESHRDRVEGSPMPVFLGGFVRTPDGTWTLDEETKRRPFVYDNDMLFGLFLSHLVDRDNPHGAGGGPGDDFLESELDQIDQFRTQLQELQVEVAEVRDDLRERAEAWDENLQETVEAWDEALQSEVADLRAEMDAVQTELATEIERLQDDLRTQTEHNAYKSLRTAVRGFDDVAETFRHRAEVSKAALGLTETLRRAIGEAVYEDRETYEEFVTRLNEDIDALADALEGEATEESYQPFTDALDSLEAVSRGDPSFTRLVTSFDRVGELSGLLEPRYEVQPEE